MIQRIRDIKLSGQTVIKKVTILAKRINDAGKAVDHIASFADDLQDDLNRFSFKVQPSLDRMQKLINKMH